MEQNPIPNTTNNQATQSPQLHLENQQGSAPEYQQPNPQQVAEQPVIINNCIYTKEILLQAYSKIMKKYIFILIFSFVGLVTTGIMCFSSDSSARIAENAFLAGLFFWFIIFTISFMRSIKATTKQREKADMLLYGAISQPVAYFYNNHLSVYNPQSQARFSVPYQAIIDITEYKDIYVITLQEKVTVLIHKNGFSLRNEDFFKAFIESKASTLAKIKFK